MLTFFSVRGYLRASLEKDLQRVTTISCPDALMYLLFSLTTRSQLTKRICTPNWPRTYCSEWLACCQYPRCHTCAHVSPETELRGPRCSFSIQVHFTCQASNLVYCILSYNRCPTVLYIGETGPNLRSRFSEHLRSIRNNTPGFPVAQHFNSAGHSISIPRY